MFFIHFVLSYGFYARSSGIFMMHFLELAILFYSLCEVFCVLQNIWRKEKKI